MLRVEIKSAEVIREMGQFESFHQVARLLGDDTAVRFKVRVPDASTKYSPGQYDISADSFLVDRYGKLTLGNIVLLPVAPSK